MRKKYIFGKKLYISILTSIVVLMTTIATTFAWVGVFANSTFDWFNIDIKGSSLEEYGVVISATGEEGTFSDTVNAIDIKRQILKNWGYRNVDQLEDNYIDYAFNTLNMHQCTNTPIIQDNKIKKLGNFRTIENNLTNNYYQFDIYVSATRYYESNSSTNYLLDVFLEQGLLSGSVQSLDLIGPVNYPSTFANPLINLPNNIIAIGGNDIISNRISINTASSARVAFEKYEVVTKGVPNLYNGKEPISTVIYSGDSYNYPTYNQNMGTYEFGGILPNESNFAIKYYNNYDFVFAKNGVNSVSMPASIYEIRGVDSETADLTLHSNTNHLIDSTNEYEKIGINNMMKITISFWIEGWDSDCFSIIDRAPITLSISMSVANETEF